MIRLRDYQKEALTSVQKAIERGVRRPAVVLATGGGKTMVFSHLIPLLEPTLPERGGKTLVLAHKEELIRQATDCIKMINPDLNVQIDMRHLKPDDNADVIVASVPTLVRMSRLESYDPSQFKTIILDECHHAAARSWVKILQYFGADTPQLPINVVGFTATMERNDTKSLGKMFDEIVFERDLLTMVKNKELVDVKFSCIDVDVDFDEISTKRGDFDPASLAVAINTEETNILLALAYKKLREQYNFKSTLMFCVDVGHCKTICAVLQSIGINAQYVTGETVKHERFEIIEDFKAGKIDVLCNVLVFTEGTDIPNIDSLFLARPTKSRPLLVQMIGRGLRLHQGKTHCHIIDIVGTRGTGILSQPSLFGIDDEESSGKGRQEDNLDEKLLLAAEKENIRLQGEMKAIEDLVQVLNVEEEVAMKFTTFDGFMALETEDSKQFVDNKAVNDAFNFSNLRWIRLEYDYWGYQLAQDTFVSVTRHREHLKTSFSLHLNRFTPRSQAIAANYKNKRIILESIMELNSNLETVINKAEAVLNSRNPFQFRNKKHKPITDKQVKFLEPKLLIKTKHYYQDNEEILSKLKESLSQIDSNRASDLIFACKYSTKSLWVRWELQRLLGPDRRATRVARKMFKQKKAPILKFAPNIYTRTS